MPAPLTRRPRPLWGIVVLFALAVTAVPLIAHFRKRRTTPPRNLTELAERLQAAHPGWHVVRATGLPNGLESGFWVCGRQCSLDELANLRRTREDGPCWRGVVLCRRELSSHLNDWGEYGVWAVEFSLFGDPEMIPQIAPLLPGECPLTK